MAHEIMERDVQAGLTVAWHGLTKVCETIKFADAFPYEISREPISVRGVEIPGYSAFVCSDDQLIAGKPVAETYAALTNSRFWEIVNNSLGSEAVIESAGTIKDRSRRFITVKLSENGDFTIGKRTFKNRISLLDSIDGSTFFYAINSSTCVVCANTARMVVNDKSGGVRFKARHTKNIISEVEGIENGINYLCGVKAQYQIAMEEAEQRLIDETDARFIFAGFIGSEAETLSTRAKGTVDRLTGLYRSGAGNSGKTLLDAYSAVTDFYSHESSGGENKPGFRAKQWLSSEYGDGAESKVSFHKSIFNADVRGNFAGINESNIDLMKRKGQALLN